MGKAVKDFTAAAASVNEAIRESTRKEKGPRREYSAEEAKPYLDSLQTSGRKGIKSPRINLCLTPENMDYCNAMAAAMGTTRTTVINDLIAKHRKEHAAEWEQIKEFRKKFKEG